MAHHVLVSAEETQMSTKSPQVSIVVPVYNEGDNILPCVRALAQAVRDEPHEILIVYDFDEDTTLPPVRAMADSLPTVRLVRNAQGSGLAGALKTGLAEARGDVVVVTMADLSDPPELIPTMAAKVRSGADVVSGSRFMAGGSQEGGPLLKSFLSRAAGLSLFYLAGLRTHDATNNFRAYSRRYLDSVRIESDGGPEVALELTVKAHLQGRRIEEVPSRWVERSAGESRFNLRKWMPKYLKWYAMALTRGAFRQRSHAS
jgi:glycosyltransferase involved in cell wall biosynthesis